MGGLVLKWRAERAPKAVLAVGEEARLGGREVRVMLGRSGGEKVGLVESVVCERLGVMEVVLLLEGGRVCSWAGLK